MRDADAIVAAARKHGPNVGEYAHQLLDVELPWRHMRQAYALVRLAEKYGDARVDRVCKEALEFDVVDVPRVRKMLERASVAEKQAEAEMKVVQLDLRFARPAAHFATRKGAAR